MRLINMLDSYFFGGTACLSDRIWFYGGITTMILIALFTLL